MDGLHRHEDRADLEERFKITGGFVIEARKRSLACPVVNCEACTLVRAAVPLPSNAGDAHQPREDLELACEEIAERISEVAHCDDAEGCPAGQLLYGLVGG